MASVTLAYDISRCNLTSVNGRYQFSTTNNYVQVGGKNFLWKNNGIWTISQGKEHHCFASKPTSLPVDVTWDYISKTAKAVRPCSMIVEKAVQSPAKTGPATAAQPTDPAPAPAGRSVALPVASVQPKSTTTATTTTATTTKGKGSAMLAKVPAAASGPSRASTSAPSSAKVTAPVGTRTKRPSTAGSNDAPAATKAKKAGKSDKLNEPENRAAKVEVRHADAGPDRAPLAAVEAAAQLQAGFETICFLAATSSAPGMTVHVPSPSALSPAREVAAGEKVTELVAAQRLWQAAVEALDGEVELLRGRLLENERQLEDQAATSDRLQAENNGLTDRAAEAARSAEESLAALRKEKDALMTQIAVLIEEKVSLAAQVSTHAANLRIATGQNTDLRRELAAVTESSVLLQDGVRVLREEKRVLEDSARILSATNSNLTADLSGAREKLVATAGKLADSEKRADTLIARAGQSHIKRDWQRIRGESLFPAGEDLKLGFEKPFLNFESFACDAITALENLGHEESAAPAVLVQQVMAPMYEATKAYIGAIVQKKKDALIEMFGAALPDDLSNDTVPKLFWFSTLQTLLPPQILALSDSVIDELIAGMGPVVAQVHERMLQDAQEGVISNEENDLRIPVLVRAFLLLFTYVSLSDPYCYLAPAPGARLSYVPERFKEILSPGARKHGQIKAGDVVEVVLCGLYFEDPAGDFSAIKAIVPPLVRRLIGVAAAPAAPLTAPAPAAIEEVVAVAAAPEMRGTGEVEISG